jgi:son of sevenless-like protein
MINRSNTIPFWVATEIVQRDNLEERAAILRKFISIADHCRALSNFNALMEILSGLNMTAISFLHSPKGAHLITCKIYRLKKTWGALSPKTLTVFQALNQLMAPDSNFKVKMCELVMPLIRFRRTEHYYKKSPNLACPTLDGTSQI